MSHTMKIQAILYRSTPDISYLLMKRPADRGDYWTPITGHVEANEKLLDALAREIEEETGISEFSYIIDLRVPQHFKKGGEEVEEHAFGVQVDTDSIRISKEHSEYAWLSNDQANARLKWEAHKTSLQVLNDMINL